MAAAQSMFRLKRPCSHCPFRSDRPGFLHRARAQEIAMSIAKGEIFHCHETTVYDEEIEDMAAGPGSQFCAGALLVMEHSEVPNQAMRMAERLGLYDPRIMDREAPTFKSMAAFVRHHGDSDIADDEVETVCAVVGAGCEAPAGFMVDGIAVPADPGEAGELHECPGCCESVCGSCSNDEGFCTYCVED